jgi:hypothetical protein
LEKLFLRNLFKMKKALSFAAISASVLTAGHASAAETFKTISGVPWELSTPSSTSDAERSQAALQACQVKIAADIATAQQVLAGTPIRISYRNVSVDKRYGDWSKTKKDDLTGVRKHKAGGVADCSYYQVTTGI